MPGLTLFSGATYHFLTLFLRAGSEGADAYDGLDRKLSEFNNDQGMTPVPRPRLMSGPGVGGTLLTSLPEVIR